MWHSSVKPISAYIGETILHIYLDYQYRLWTSLLDFISLTYWTTGVQSVYDYAHKFSISSSEYVNLIAQPWTMMKIFNERF